MSKDTMQDDFDAWKKSQLYPSSFDVWQAASTASAAEIVRLTSIIAKSRVRARALTESQEYSIYEKWRKNKGDEKGTAWFAWKARALLAASGQPAMQAASAAEIARLTAELARSVPESEQEPVAWRCKATGAFYLGFDNIPQSVIRMGVQSLYAYPQQASAEPKPPGAA